MFIKKIRVTCLVNTDYIQPYGLTYVQIICKHNRRARLIRLFALTKVNPYK